ncbi:MAG: formate/nitrite transporter family protein [Cellulomonadaceae bacterium]|nr:formate/nitrite transporter family protein [Cellulomonadaceae bacterium]
MAETPAPHVIFTESSVEPSLIVDGIVNMGAYKAKQANRTILIRAVLASFVFGATTMLAGTVATQTGQAWLGALVFPTALVIVLLLGLELVTSTMGFVPLAWWRGEARGIDVPRSIGVAIGGHIIGCGLFALVFYATVTEWGRHMDAPLVTWIIELAEHKTLNYASMGLVAGVGLAVLRGFLCNWLVSMGGVMMMTSRTTGGKIAAIWLPIFLFFALGWEHSVVNLFVMPTAMLCGAPITFGDWWLWNEIPVMIGNLLGASILTAMGLWLCHRWDVPWHHNNPKHNTYHEASLHLHDHDAAVES